MTEKIEIQNIEISKLKTDQDNPNRISDRNLKAIKKSIEKYGFIVPVITNKDLLIADGHQRIKAAEELGIKQVPVIVLSVDEVSRKLLQQVMNKVKGTHDLEMDEESWKYIIEHSDDGLNDLMDLIPDDSDLINKLIKGEETIIEDIVEVDAYERAKKKTHQGDIFKLGNHRLMCGDSTSKIQVEKLMNGKTDKLLFTDPPYNINYKAIKKDEKIKNDNMSEEDFNKFLMDSLENSKAKQGYVFCNWKFYHIFYQAMTAGDKIPKACIVWDKETRAQNLDKYFKEHEFIIYYGPFGNHKTLRGDVFRLNRERSDEHPTMKPLKLCSTFILDSSNQEDNVLDLFGGSGSTLIACEQLNRRCFMMEIDPVYVQIIIDRWEKFTGKKAIKGD